MNKIIYTLFILLFLTIILICSFSKNNYNESFVPKIVKETYRPLHRNIRKTYEGFYDKTSICVSNFFRKFGIL